MNTTFLTGLATRLIGEACFVTEAREEGGLGRACWNGAVKCRQIVLDPVWNDGDLLYAFLHEVGHHKALTHVLKVSEADRAAARVRVAGIMAEPGFEERAARLVQQHEDEANEYAARMRPLVERAFAACGTSFDAIAKG